MRRLAGLLLGLQLVGTAACEPVRAPAHPSLKLAQRRGAFAVHEALEKLIREGRDKEVDREQAYELVKTIEDDGTAEYAFARAAVVGRVAEKRGLTAIWLVREVETWARACVDRDPDYGDGAGRRMLGSLYVLAGDRAEKGDSETGLEILEQLVHERPDDPVNRLRLAEGYVVLGDPGSAGPHLCAASRRREALARFEQELLDAMIAEVGGRASLACEGDAAPKGGVE